MKAQDILYRLIWKCKLLFIDTNFVYYYWCTARQNLHFEHKTNINNLSALMIVILLAKPSFNTVFYLESTCKAVCPFCGSSLIPPGWCLPFCTCGLWASVELFPLVVWNCLIPVQNQIKQTAYACLGTNQLQKRPHNNQRISRFQLRDH